MPERIQLHRAAGWRMPPNTLKVDRTTKWGNPFIIGQHGNAAQCIYYFLLLCGGFQCLTLGHDCAERQLAFGLALRAEKNAGFPNLRGRNLGCWCPIGSPCHGDILLEIVNTPRGQKIVGNIDATLARYGWRIVNGQAIRIS